MKTIATISLLLLLPILFSTCKKDSTSDCIDGNGEIRQETRNVGEFNTVVANGAYNISYGQTVNTQVDLFGDSNILPIIETTVTNKNLLVTVANDQCYTTQQTLEVTLSAPVVKSITLNGAGEIKANNIVQDELHLITSGSAILNSSLNVGILSTTITGEGNAQFLGSADKASLTISGSGSILASVLIVDECTIVISGTGDVRVHAESKLNVTISGAGSVYYTGDPALTTNITGTGQVVKL